MASIPVPGLSVGKGTVHQRRRCCESTFWVEGRRCECGSGAWFRILIALFSFACWLVFVMDALIAESPAQRACGHCSWPHSRYLLSVGSLKFQPLSVFGAVQRPVPWLLSAFRIKFPFLLLANENTQNLVPGSSQLHLCFLPHAPSAPARYSSLFLAIPHTGQPHSYLRALHLGSPEPPCSFPSGLCSSLPPSSETFFDHSF